MTRVAYLVSDYHAPSHTFVRREIAALRALEVDVIAFSVQRGTGASDGAEHLLGRSPFAYLAALVSNLCAGPGRFISAWWLATRHRAPGVRALIWSQFHFVEAMLLARLMHRARVTHLHSHFANSGATVALIASRYARIPWSLTLHGISETDYPAGMLLADKIERATFVACASFFMRAQAMRIVAQRHWAKMAVVRCGVDLASLPHPAPHSEDGPARIICVGRLSPEKGFLGLLDALAAIAAEDLEFELLIVGDGPLAGEVRAKVGEVGLCDRIDFAGALPESETLAAIAQADILVLPSLMEGLPVVLVEAMAMGRPVLASRVAGIPELVEQGGGGYLFTPSDQSDLLRGLRMLISDRSHWQGMGLAGRTKVEEEFQIQRSGSRMKRLFDGEELS